MTGLRFDLALLAAGMQPAVVRDRTQKLIDFARHPNTPDGQPGGGEFIGFDEQVLADMEAAIKLLPDLEAAL